METFGAQWAVTSPDTPATDLAAIAHSHPELGGEIARHPNAYPALLDWLDQYGDEFTRETVAWRRNLDRQGIIPQITMSPPPMQANVMDVSAPVYPQETPGGTILDVPAPAEPSFMPSEVNLEPETSQLHAAASPAVMPSQPVPIPVYHPQDAPNGGMAVLGFFFPVVGLVLYLVWKDQTPLKAKSAGKGALAGVITIVGLYMIYFIFIAILIGSF
ncbi:MAG: DUF4870 domain-containing protein [Propionibacteriaceae bacterium]|jgi:hypothetical protein|nr:DUF4870 domain-containing protein [Propionibacteriaceae bacterium]